VAPLDVASFVAAPAILAAVAAVDCLLPARRAAAADPAEALRCE
jgi:ABC-type lipoprotein release transport system permease subunit